MNNPVATQTHTQQYLDAAMNIGTYLAKEAIWYKDMCNWTGHEVAVVGQNYETAYKACGIELYSGLTGIAWFLAELYVKTQDPVIKYTLDGTLKSIEYNLDEGLANNYGYYSGRVGLGFTLWKIGNKIGEDKWKKIGIEQVKSIQDKPIGDHEVDIISGAAGAISALVKLYYAEQDEDFLNLTKKCGDFLIDKAIKEDDAWSWKTVDQNYALTGYSHGASGMASALLEVYATTQDETYWHAAMNGFKYEKKWFNEQVQNWPDLRQYTGTGLPNFGAVWCHGAPGIAIAHIKAYEMTKQEYFLQEATTAINTTMKTVERELNPNSGTNCCLCHGLIGNSDILLYASDVLQKPEYRAMAQRSADFAIQHYDKSNTVYPSGVNDPSGKTGGQQENPGLMLGSAGTGMFYLRLHDSQSISSPLVP
ncbi:MAG: hypothetical protein HRT68_00545 [Flavobacteriaceae bacterium]|nr:hypothetical protein [Flavobacteriaceae bacterium]